jgi:voltage-gated potassium channel
MKSKNRFVRFIANTPISGVSQVIGGIWIIVGSTLFFGTIVATVTGYFMRPLQGPVRKIIETIEYNLEQLDDLSVEELDLLKDTVDTLIDHMERLKQRQEERASPT